MPLFVLIVGIFASFALIGLYYENRRQTDALARIAEALEGIKSNQ